jgi:BMFP domain-containing protein YqiC
LGLANLAVGACPGHIMGRDSSTEGPTPMTETRGRVFDEIGRLMTDAAGAASGLRREVETIVRAQASRILSDLDLVRRDEFEAVRAMAERAREENERLAGRLAELERKAAPASEIQIADAGDSAPKDTQAG